MSIFDDARLDVAPQQLGILLLPEFSSLCFAALFEPLRAANLVAARSLYRWRIYSADGLPVISSGGVAVEAHGPLANANKLAALFVVSGFNASTYWTSALAAQLKRLAVLGTELGGIDTGSDPLARSGLLDGYQATIHWEELLSFARNFPRVRVVPHRSVIDRNRFSAAGAMSTLDLMIRVIRSQHGFRLAFEVAKKFIYAGDSTLGDSQQLMLVPQLALQSQPLARAVELMHDAISDPIPISEIARRVGVHQRTLENIYKRYLGDSPARYYLRTRLDAARKLLVQTDISISTVASQCGFQSGSAFSRAYRCEFNTSPQQSRRLAWVSTPSSLGRYERIESRRRARGNEAR